MKRSRIVFSRGLVTTLLIGLSLLLGFVAFNRFFGYTIADRPDSGRVPTAMENRQTAEAGIPLVEAIYRYKNRVGLWPRDLSELIPDDLSARQLSGWRYERRLDGYWTLTNYRGYPVSAVRFKHLPSGEAKWVLHWGDGDDDLDVRQPTTKTDVVSPEVQERNRLKELSRRIAVYPKEIAHFQGAISYFVREGALEPAAHLCARCRARHPTHWWPNMMQAEIAIQLKQGAEAVDRFITWVEEDQCFARYYYLAHVYVRAGSPQQACDSLAKAATYPLKGLEVSSDQTGEVLAKGEEWYAWHAALIAMRSKRYGVVLSICDRWEEFVTKEKSYGDRSFHVFRAACYLRMGQTKHALTEVQRAFDAQSRNQQVWAKNLDQLEKAIKAGDTTFSYDPGFAPQPLELLTVYE